MFFPLTVDSYSDGAHELCPLSLETKEFIIVTGFSVQVVVLDVSKCSLFSYLFNTMKLLSFD